jgi:alkylation response protein AidB-like acyl-CoA dehydrogenase
MEFGLSEEQSLLQSSIGRYLESNASLDRVKDYVDSGALRADDVWSGLSELGVPGIIIGEEHGGVGLGMLEAALIADTLGGGVAPVPFASTAVMAPLALSTAGSDEQKSRWLPALADGSVIAGAAFTEIIGSRQDAGVTFEGGSLNGRTLFVLDFEADVYLVADENRALYLVEADAPGLSRQLLTTVDKTRRVGELVFVDTPAEVLPGSADPEVCARVIDAGRIMLAADTIGAARTMLAKAVSYSKERVQFGRTIGSFQAVKHMCADMAAQLEPCVSMLWYAAYAFDNIPREARLTACHTKAHTAEVGTFVARTSTEVHGGIGFTDELGLHLWFKRISANRQLLGGPDRVREEAARLQGLVTA